MDESVFDDPVQSDSDAYEEVVRKLWCAGGLGLDSL